MPQELRSDILAFYRDFGLSVSNETSDSDRARVLKELNRLQAVDVDLRHPAVVSMGIPLPD
jgi:hypothetical protein